MNIAKEHICPFDVSRLSPGMLVFVEELFTNETEIPNVASALVATVKKEQARRVVPEEEPGTIHVVLPTLSIQEMARSAARFNATAKRLFASADLEWIETAIFFLELQTLLLHQMDAAAKNVERNVN